MGTLTIQLDDNLILRAEAVSEQTGKSVAELFADYLASFGAQIEPSKPEKRSLFGSMKGTAEIVGDIVSPLPADDWEVLRP